VGGEAVAAEGDEKELAPAGVVAVVEAEGDRDVEFNRGSIGVGVGAGGVGVGGRGDVAVGGVESGGGCRGSGGGRRSGELLVQGGFACIKGESALLELAFFGFNLGWCHGGGGWRRGFRVLGGFGMRRPGGKRERPAAEARSG
jgi:hypothetical protein